MLIDWWLTTGDLNEQTDKNVEAPSLDPRTLYNKKKEKNTLKKMVCKSVTVGGPTGKQTI